MHQASTVAMPVSAVMMTSDITRSFSSAEEVAGLARLEGGHDSFGTGLERSGHQSDRLRITLRTAPFRERQLASRAGVERPSPERLAEDARGGGGEDVARLWSQWSRAGDARRRLELVVEGRRRTGPFSVVSAFAPRIVAGELLAAEGDHDAVESQINGPAAKT